MFAAVRSAWPLFVGLGMIMLGNGLQGSLLGIRAAAEQFTTETTGLIMSGYFLGFLAGAVITPKIVGNVGHVRVFAALASTASAAALLHAVFVDPLVWGVMRCVTGFCYAGLYIVAESWLNDRSTNETRGSMLSVYMVVVLGGIAGGQFLLNLSDPNSFVLFVLASVLVSMALVPISVSVGSPPDFSAPTPTGVRALYRTSPLGVIGSLGTGFANGAIFSMGAVYAGLAGLDVSEIAIFMSMLILGGMAFQWPIGRLSDKLDRRRVLAGVTFAAALFGFAGPFLSDGPVIGLYAIAFLLGGMSFPMYSLCLAHTNDYLTPKQMVAASGSLMLVNGAGAIFGPIVVSQVMANAGAGGFFTTVGAIHAAIGVFAIYRMTRRASVPIEDQGPNVPVATSMNAATATLSLDAFRDHRDSDLAAMATGRKRRG